MADDNRDFFEKVESFWAHRGHSWSPEKAQDHFKLYGAAERSASLDTLDAELNGIEPSMSNVRKYSELHELRQNLDQIHHALLKNGR